MFIFAPNFVVLGIIAGLSWMTSPIYNVVQFSYRIALIPDRLQGRVNSAFRLLAFGFQPIGAVIAGVLLKYVGTTNTLLFYFVVMLFLGIVTTFNSHVRNARPIGEVSIAE